jgi:type 1 glutamine amidotransferase
MRVLYFTKSAGYEHAVVHKDGGAPSYSERVLQGIGAARDIDFAFSKDGSLFTPTYLAGFDAVMFYTSGDLLSVGEDGAPPLTPEGKRALIDSVAGGKGFLAVHSGGDTFHTGESGGGNPTDRRNRYVAHGEASDPYIRMLGGEFINHGAQQAGRTSVCDPNFPGCGNLGDTFACFEEWYSTKEFAPNLHVLLVMETAGMEGVDYQRPPYPLAWARAYERGRVWFNGMGHREDVWDNPKFQAMLIGGLEWAGGRVDADVSPNLNAVAPQAAVFPPYRPGT